MKTPIHFGGCSFCTTPPPLKKKFSSLLPTKSGALRPDAPLWPNPAASSPGPTFVATLGLFDAPGWFGSCPMCVRSETRELSARRGGEQLAALTRE